MIIYHIPISLYSFKVRLALRLKGVEIELREPPGGTYRSAAYRLINPAGTVPALVDGDMLLIESDAIIEYLDDVGLGRPLLPAAAADKARDRMLAGLSDTRLEPAVRKLFTHVAPSRRDHAAVVAFDAALAELLSLLDGFLHAEGPFTAGDRPGLADCALTATSLWLLALKKPLALAAAPGPRLSRVLAAMERHNAVAQSIADYRFGIEHWIDAAGMAQ